MVPYCESLPDIFNKMNVMVSERFPRDLAEQCKVPWLSDDYFVAAAESRAGVGAPAAPSAQPGATIAERRTATAKCRALFARETAASGRVVHGVLVGPLIDALDAIIYRETRQAVASSK